MYYKHVVIDQARTESKMTIFRNRETLYENITKQLTTLRKQKQRQIVKYHTVSTVQAVKLERKQAWNTAVDWMQTRPSARMKEEQH